MSVPVVLNSVTSAVNHLDSFELVVITGVLTSAGHYLLDHFKSLTKVKNVLVSFCLPLGGAVLAVLAKDGNLAVRYPEVFLAAQATYQLVEAIKRAALKSLTSQV